MRIEPKSTVVGQLHAQAIRENVGAAAGFVKNHAESALGTTAGYARGFCRGLFGSKTAGGATSVPNA